MPGIIIAKCNCSPALKLPSSFWIFAQSSSSSPTIYGVPILLSHVDVSHRSIIRIILFFVQSIPLWLPSILLCTTIRGCDWRQGRCRVEKFFLFLFVDVSICVYWITAGETWCRMAWIVYFFFLVLIIVKSIVILECSCEFTSLGMGSDYTREVAFYLRWDKVEFWSCWCDCVMLIAWVSTSLTVSFCFNWNVKETGTCKRGGQRAMHISLLTSF